MFLLVRPASRLIPLLLLSSFHSMQECSPPATNSTEGIAKLFSDQKGSVPYPRELRNTTNGLIRADELHEQCFSKFPASPPDERVSSQRIRWGPRQGVGIMSGSLPGVFTQVPLLVLGSDACDAARGLLTSICILILRAWSSMLYLVLKACS